MVQIAYFREKFTYRFLCLHFEKQDQLDFFNSYIPGTVVGWGFGENNKLLQAKMSIVPLENCIFSQSVRDKNYCAMFENGNF